jgi:hypothetical protein
MPVIDEDTTTNQQIITKRPPSWLRTTPAKDILGRTVIAVRCSAEPLPSEP